MNSLEYNYSLFVGAKFEQISNEQGNIGMIQITAIEVNIDSKHASTPEVFITFITERAAGNRVNLREFARYLAALDFIPTTKSFILL